MTSILNTKQKGTESQCLQFLSTRRTRDLTKGCAFDGSHFCARRSSLKTLLRSIFLTLRPSRVQILNINTKQKGTESQCLQFLSTRRTRDLTKGCAFDGSHFCARRSSLKTLLRSIFLTLRPSRVQILNINTKQKGTESQCLQFLSTRRTRDLNPRAGFPTYSLSRGAPSPLG